MKSSFYKYEITLKNQNILNKNTKSIVIEYLRCNKCKKIPFIEIPDIQCLNCFFLNIYKITRKINQEYTRDDERKSVFETINIVKRMMLSAIDNKESLSDYIECINEALDSSNRTDDMVILWAKSIRNYVKETNKIPIGKELKNIIYSW